MKAQGRNILVAEENSRCRYKESLRALPTKTTSELDIFGLCDFVRDDQMSESEIKTYEW